MVVLCAVVMFLWGEDVLVLGAASQLDTGAMRRLPAVTTPHGPVITWASGTPSGARHHLAATLMSSAVWRRGEPIWTMPFRRFDVDPARARCYVPPQRARLPYVDGRSVGRGLICLRRWMQQLSKQLLDRCRKRQSDNDRRVALRLPHSYTGVNSRNST